MKNKDDWETPLIEELMKADATDDPDRAIEQYCKCIDRIPEPVGESIYATQIYMSMGEIYFLKNDYLKAHDFYGRAVNCVEGLGNPLIHLRIGQSSLEVGNHRQARDELLRAYATGGTLMFETENPKYFDAIRDLV